LKPNPLLLKSSLPLFAEIKSEHILPAVSTDLNALKENFVGDKMEYLLILSGHNVQTSYLIILISLDFEAVLLNPQKGEAWGQKRVEYDYETVVEKLEKIQFPLAYSWGVVGHLMGVQNSDDLRKAHDTIQPQVIEVYQKIGQSQALYIAMTALQKRNSVW
jgi:Zn-dependent oligopeptidase